MNNIFQKISKHEIPIDTSFWEEMEERLMQQKRRKFVPYWWIASSIAAAVALFLMLNIDVLTESKEQRTKSKDVLAQSNEQRTQNNEQRTKSKEQRRFGTEHRAESTEQRTENIAFDTAINSVHRFAQTSGEESYPSFEELERDTKQAIKQSTNQHVKRPVLLAANVRLGGQTAGGTRNNMLNADLPRDINDNAYNGIEAGLSNVAADKSLNDLLAEYPEIRYLPPISAGLSVRKYLTNRIALETGLFYTYLQTDFVYKNDWMQQTARIKMHYLGIPINVIIDIVQKPKWSLYGSVGGAVEKGLWLNYHKKTTYTWSPDYNEDQYLGEGIKRIQMSMTAALGIDVTIIKNLSIYFEPRVGYYFRNVQPLSVRTASPLNVELNAGLRWTVK